MFVEKLIQNPIFIYIILPIILGLVIIKIFEYLNNQKCFFYDIRRGTFYPKRAFHFKGKEYRMFTIVNFCFWNKWKKTVRDSDIAKEKPIQICLASGVELFDAHIIKMSDKASGCKIIKRLKQKDGSFIITIDFQYLEKGDGFVLRIRHSGYKKHKIKFEGKIIDGKPFKRIRDLFFIKKNIIIMASFLTFQLIQFILNIHILTRIFFTAFLILMIYFIYFITNHKIPKQLRIKFRTTKKY